MARWEPDATGRLQKAALELFLERGYEHVTAADIAARAGLARRTFFRHFPDKREVLFAGGAELPEHVGQALRETDPALAPFAATVAALARVAAQMPDDGGYGRQRRAVIRASAELQERERTKLAAMGEAIEVALGERGVAPGAAALIAQAGLAVFSAAYDRYVDGAEGGRDFAACIEQTAGELRGALAM